ncbi:hypothetical protein MMC10_000638 [Thelotrema lepadinum]|nr:hypothetical protein [Thelotrema lepadinum]
MSDTHIAMQNVFVIGAQSTGKTTIVNALEEFFDKSNAPNLPTTQRKPVIIREVARNVLKTYNFSREDIRNHPLRGFQLQQRILEAQFQAEKAVTSYSPESWYITDRSGLDPIVYAYLYVGEEASQELLASPAWRELEERMRLGNVFLCEAGTHWLIDDGTRLMPENEAEWIQVDTTFRQLLETREINYSVIPKELYELDKRVDLVTEALLRSHSNLESDCKLVEEP